MYMKILTDSGKFHVVKLDPSQYTVEGLLHDLYQSKGYADSNEEEYSAEESEASEESEEEVEVSADETAE